MGTFVAHLRQRFEICARSFAPHATRFRPPPAWQSSKGHTSSSRPSPLALLDSDGCYYTLLIGLVELPGLLSGPPTLGYPHVNASRWTLMYARTDRLRPAAPFISADASHLYAIQLSYSHIVPRTLDPNHQSATSTSWVDALTTLCCRTRFKGVTTAGKGRCRCPCVKTSIPTSTVRPLLRRQAHEPGADEPHVRQVGPSDQRAAQPGRAQAQGGALARPRAAARGGVQPEAPQRALGERGGAPLHVRVHVGEHLRPRGRGGVWRGPPARCGGARPASCRWARSREAR